MSLDVSVQARRGAFILDADFTTDGRVTGLFGASGVGKTTLMNVIAGLIEPRQGRIAIDGTVLIDTARGTGIPAHRRRIGYVFQEGRLFPHLSVRQNLLYGRWFAPRAARAEPFGEVVDLLDLSPLLHRGTTELSGGEKQRVAIGRALIASPRLLLLDEPLASIDQARKDEVMPYLERLRDHARMPMIYVSHSTSEVARLADIVVLMRDGRVVATGPSKQTLRQAISRDLDEY